MTTAIIAECGSCHDGDIKKAYRLIDEARQAGADFAKFQFWSNPEGLYARRGINDPSVLEIYRRYRMPKEWLKRLRKYCDSVGIEFLCTTYLPDDCQRLREYQEITKIAAGEWHFKSLMDEAARNYKAVIASVPAPMWDRRYECVPGGVRTILLYCVVKYPAQTDEVSMPFFRDDMEGFSDHTRSLLSGAVAVSRGAAVVEKHLRLPDTDRRNPDYPHSLTPDQFRKYVDNIREAERLIKPESGGWG